MNKLKLKLKLKEMENKENNTKEVTKVTLRSENEAKESNTLMRKTKAQLVEIIFRKDGLERSLRTEIEQMRKSFNKDCVDKIATDISEITKKYNSLKKDFEDICDAKISMEFAYKELLNRSQKYVYIFAIVGFISVALNFILLVK